MKKKLSFICVVSILSLLLVLTGCSNMENEKTKNSTNFDELELDYNDATSFENALNSGKKVNGKTVKFDVLEYKPDSLLGINCWAGEHLNFISDKELEVKAGDTIIGRIKEEPTSVLGSWEIKYDVIEIKHNEISRNELENEKTNEDYDSMNESNSLPTNESSSSSKYPSTTETSKEDYSSSNKNSNSNNSSSTSTLTTESSSNESKSESTSSTTLGEKNALSQAKNYISIMAFSYDGLIAQLKFEGYSDSEAKYGADNCGANWNNQALKKAKEYLNVMAFSKSGLIEQLKFDKFTGSQANYGADNCGANWNEQASKKAKSYLDIMSFSRQGLIDQLIFDGFTNSQAEYGATSVGY